MYDTLQMELLSFGFVLAQFIFAKLSLLTWNWHRLEKVDTFRRRADDDVDVDDNVDTDDVRIDFVEKQKVFLKWRP